MMRRCVHLCVRWHHVLIEIQVHVDTLSTALSGIGATPVTESTYSFGVSDPKSFVTLANVLEGVGVSAYLGAAAAIVDGKSLIALSSVSFSNSV